MHENLTVGPQSKKLPGFQSLGKAHKVQSRGFVGLASVPLVWFVEGNTRENIEMRGRPWYLDYHTERMVVAMR